MDCVNVAIRIKPSTIDESKSLQKISDDPPTVYIADRHQTYSFDKIFDQETDQNEIFVSLINPLIEKALLGYNCTAFAYGQTGTGKTYTMGSDMKELNGQNMGIIKRVFIALFDKTSTTENIEIELSVCEIYQEKVYDLLGDNKTALNVKGINNITLTQVKLKDLKSTERMLVKSCRRRHTGETKQNLWSSRSHAVFTIYVNAKDENGTRCTKLNLVDLAGCESIKKTGTQDYQLNEAIKINMGLLSVGLVISALTLNRTCIPYRQSMLTRILYDSLNRNSYITLIACVSGNLVDIHETMQTFEFASKTKKMKSKPQIRGILVDTNFTTFRNHSQYLAAYDTRTPLKRAHSYMHTSTSIKRPKLTSTPHFQNLRNNTKLSSSIISPIAKEVVNKLENQYGSSAEFSTKNSQFYDTMYRLIQQEVHMQTSNKSSYIPGDLENKRKSGMLLRQSSPLDTILIQENLQTVQDIASEISTIIDTSNDDLEISGIAPNINKIENKIVFVDKSSKDDNKENSFTFKIPELPKWRSSLETSHCIEPNNLQVQDMIHPRRSLRLSIKRTSIDNVSNECRIFRRTSSVSTNSRRSTDIAHNLLNSHMNNNFKESKITENNDIRLSHNIRRSARISLRAVKNVNDEENSPFQKPKPKNKNVRNKCKDKLSLKKPKGNNVSDSFNVDVSDVSASSDDIIDTSQEDLFDENTMKTFPAFTKRRSMRLSIKRALTSTMTSQRSNDSSRKSIVTSIPRIARTSEKIEIHKYDILRNLNTGNTKQLQRLHTIGTKTAEQICLFRKINGPFKTIGDLQQILYRGKSYERFLTANCLDLERADDSSLS